MPARAERRRRRGLDRRGTRRRGLRHGGRNETVLTGRPDGGDRDAHQTTERRQTMATTTTATAAEVMALESANVLQTYRRSPVVFERGSGCRLYDGAGRGYLDF